MQLKTNTILLEQIEQTDQRFRCAFSLSGTAISQMRDRGPSASTRPR